MIRMFRAAGVMELLLIALMLELAVAGTMARLLWVQWEESERIATQKAHKEADTVVGHVAQTLERVELLMALMTERIGAAAPDSPVVGAIAPEAAPEAAMSTFDRIAQRLPGSTRLLIVDAAGRGRPLPGWDGIDRLPPAVFPLHANQGIAFAITAAITAEDAPDHRGLVVSRRIDREDGRFGGIIAIALDADMLSGLLDSPDLSLDSIRLIGEDGRLLSSWIRAALGAEASPQLPASIGSWVVAGSRAILVAEPVPGFPLRVVATVPRTSSFQPWLRLLLWIGCAFLVVTVLTVFGIASIIREVFRRVAAEEKLSKANAELQILISKTRKLASVDALTGIGNRRFFNERFEAEIRQARISHRPLSLIMLDLDHFKLVNDRYGHSFGDRVLATSAAVLRSVLRESDEPARFGGEEFVVILPNTDLKGACRLAERVCKAFAKPNHHPDGAEAGTGADGGLTVTVSIGVAQFQAGEEADDLVARADAALYRSKREGRNRVSTDLLMA